MSGFVITPTNVEFLESLFRNPSTGQWTIPIMTFNTRYINPYYGEVDVLNDDPTYQKSVVDYFYLRLKEKWLFRDPTFRKLLKYFRVEKNGDKGTVRLINKIGDVNKIDDMDETDRKHIFKYIDKYLITKHLVKKTLRQYLSRTGIKWYDLFNNTDMLKRLFAHKLKRLIKTTIYQLENQEKAE
jgi:hypothetical protein